MLLTRSGKLGTAIGRNLSSRDRLKAGYARDRDSDHPFSLRPACWRRWRSTHRRPPPSHGRDKKGVTPRLGKKKRRSARVLASWNCNRARGEEGSSTRVSPTAPPSHGLARRPTQAFIVIPLFSPVPDSRGTKTLKRKKRSHAGEPKGKKN